MWYVIQVYTGRETETAQQCREQVLEKGEEAFVPLVQRQTKIRGERTMIETKLFPGYEGKVKKILRHKRLAVLEIPLLGRMVEVTLGLGVVERRDE